MLAFHPHGREGLASPSPDSVWIDLVSPSETEIEFVEDHTGLVIPTLDDLREIERSSQLSVEGEVMRMSMPVVADADSDHPVQSYLGLILTPRRLVTVRFEPLKVFSALSERAHPQARPGASVEAFITLLEALVDRQADLLERGREQLDAISREIFAAPSEQSQRAARSNTVLHDRLRTIGCIAERVSLIRDSLLGIGRIAPFAMEAAKAWITPDLAARLLAVRQDVDSLNQFEEHLTNKVQFLLDAALGFISIAQNDTFKVLTIASVVGIPPTLVASWYGMNFHVMPELSWTFGYGYGVALILISALAPLAWFKWRGWF